LSAGTLSPAFSYKTTNYTATVDYSVTSLAISAIPSNSKASVTSVTGNDKLAVGANTIKIVVQAENGVTATYTVTVTRKAQESAQDPGNEDDPAPEITETVKEFTVNGVALSPADSIPADVIPADFEKETIVLEGAEYPCLSFSNGELTLLYLTEEDADQGQLYLYDSLRDAAYPFIQLKSEFGYLILMLPNEQLIPDNFSERSISIEGKGVATAYQMPMQQSDFFIVYGMNQSGTSGWYQYDMAEGTYQRYLLTEVTGVVQETVEEASEEDSTELADAYKGMTTKNNLLLYIGIGLIGVILVVIGILIAVRVKSKKKQTEEDQDEIKFMDI
jgi:flagellar basal body-associated protein FliL